VNFTFYVQDWAMLAPYFHDLYDMSVDPFQLRNAYGEAPAGRK
jgi:hypothetical protein